MTVTTNGAAVTSTIGSNLSAGTPTTFPYTCPAGTDCLVFMEGSVTAGGVNSTPPSAVSYNGLALTQVPSSFAGNSVFMGCSIWYLLAPPTGSSFTVSATYASTAENGLGLAVIPLKGVHQGAPVGTAATATGNSTSPGVTATGGVSGDLYLGVTGDPNATTITSGGLQTSLWTQTSRGSFIFGGDSLPGSGSGAFSWTIASSQWAATVVAFKAAAPLGASLVGAASDIVYTSAALSTTAAPFAPILLDNAAHVNGSDQISMGTGPGTGTGDTAEVAFTKLKQWAIDANTNFSKIFRVRSIQAPVTGFSIVVAAGITDQVLNPVGTLAAGSIVFPPNPGDQQPFILKSSQTVTAFSATTSDGTSVNGVPGTLPANVALKWIFEAPLNTWFREQ